MSSGVARVYVGSYQGTGVARDIKEIGFRPKRVEFFNEQDLATSFWQKSMADASLAQRVTAGDLTLITSQGVTPLAAGFRVGTDNEVNGSGDTIHFTAYE